MQIKAMTLDKVREELLTHDSSGPEYLKREMSVSAVKLTRSFQLCARAPDLLSILYNPIASCAPVLEKRCYLRKIMPSFQEKSPLKSEELQQSTVYQDFYYHSIISSIGTKNPNPFPIRKKFGFLSFRGDYGTRLLILPLGANS